MISLQWITEVVKMFKIFKKVVDLITKEMENRREGLTLQEYHLVEIKIQGGIFQDGSLSTQLFVIVIVLLNYYKKDFKNCKTR